MVIDLEQWEKAKEKALIKNTERQEIGTLSEKTVHAVVKKYYEPDEEFQEIWLDGKCADIYTKDRKIIEIQTRSFNALKPKLDVFLPNYDVTVVLPIADHKQIIWVDPDTGELSKPGQNRKYASPYYAFRELYSIRNYINSPNLHIILLMIDVVEYKLLLGKSKDRKKYGAKRYDRIPTNLNDEIILYSAKDYMQFVPLGLPEEFTSKEFSKCAKISERNVGFVLGTLRILKVIERCEKKKGNAYLYRIIETY